MQVKSGPWDRERVETWLTRTVVPLRLATAGKRGPLVQSVWFAFEGDSLWCATQASSLLAKRLTGDERVGWEVSPDEPPYRGVRGTGVAEVVTDQVQVQATLNTLLARYGQANTKLAAWLQGRIENEVAIRISQLRVTSWDFSSRMG